MPSLRSGTPRRQLAAEREPAPPGPPAARHGDLGLLRPRAGRRTARRGRRATGRAARGRRRGRRWRRSRPPGRPGRWRVGRVVVPEVDDGDVGHGSRLRGYSVQHLGRHCQHGWHDVEGAARGDGPHLPRRVRAGGPHPAGDRPPGRRVPRRSPPTFRLAGGPVLGGRHPGVPPALRRHRRGDGGGRARRPGPPLRLRAGLRALCGGQPRGLQPEFRPDRCDPTDPDLQAAGQAAFAQLLYAVAEAQGRGWRPDVATADLSAVVWAGVHGVAGLTILGALDRSVSPAGGDADLSHLTVAHAGPDGPAATIPDAPRRRTMTMTSNPYLAGNFGPGARRDHGVRPRGHGDDPRWPRRAADVRNGPNPRAEVDPATAPLVRRRRDGPRRATRRRQGRVVPQPLVGGAGMEQGEGRGPNTNVIGHAGRTLAIVESGPTRRAHLRPRDGGSNDFGGTLGRGLHRPPERGPGTPASCTR